MIQHLIDNPIIYLLGFITIWCWIGGVYYIIKGD